MRSIKQGVPDCIYGSIASYRIRYSSLSWLDFSSLKANCCYKIILTNILQIEHHLRLAQGLDVLCAFLIFVLAFSIKLCWNQYKVTKGSIIAENEHYPPRYYLRCADRIKISSAPSMTRIRSLKVNSRTDDTLPPIRNTATTHLPRFGSWAISVSASSLVKRARFAGLP